MPSIAVSLAGIILAGCTAPGQENRANVYDVNQINRPQQVDSILITMLAPAQIEVANERNRKTAQIGGALLGIVAGGIIGANVNSSAALGMGAGGVAGAGVASMIEPEKVLVNGVTITYSIQGKHFSSTQVGRICEYNLGPAQLIQTSSGETRVQANTTCPTVVTQ